MGANNNFLAWDRYFSSYRSLLSQKRTEFILRCTQSYIKEIKMMPSLRMREVRLENVELSLIIPVVVQHGPSVRHPQRSVALP